MECRMYSSFGKGIREQSHRLSWLLLLIMICGTP